MIALVVILLLLALVFGAGAVLEGLAWLLLIALVLVVAAVWVGWSSLRQATRPRT